MSRDHRSKGHMDQMPKAEEAKHYLKMEPIQHQRILPQPQQTQPAIQYHESSPILKAPTIKQMVQQTMKQQQQNHIVIDGEHQHQQLQGYTQHQGEEEEEEEEMEEEAIEASQEGDVLEILGADGEEEELEQQT